MRSSLIGGTIHRAMSAVLNLWNYTPWAKQLRVSRYRVASARVPEAFDGFRIVQITDLHGRMFGPEQADLAACVRKLRPDLILITGDMVTDNYDGTCRDAARELYKAMDAIAPSYAILGNHEIVSDRFMMILKDIENSPVRLLRGESVRIARDGSETEDKMVPVIRLAGMDSGPADGMLRRIDGDPDYVEDRLRDFLPRNDEYTVLMNHKPEALPYCARCGVDLVFSGHAHGGLIRLGGDRSLIAPDQGFFPKYTRGLYREGHTVEVVGTGLGGPRLGIRPEVVFVELGRRAK